MNYTQAENEEKIAEAALHAYVSVCKICDSPLGYELYIAYLQANSQLFKQRVIRQKEEYYKRVVQ